MLEREPMQRDIIDLQKRTAQHDFVINKMESTIDKIADVSMNVSRLLAVHEQRIDQAEEDHRNFKDLLEVRRDEFYRGISTVNDKISTMSQSNKEEIDRIHKDIVSEVKQLTSSISDNKAFVIDKTQKTEENLTKVIDSKIDKINSRMGKLEKLSWVVIGAASVIGAVLSQVSNIIKLMS